MTINIQVALIGVKTLARQMATAAATLQKEGERNLERAAILVETEAQKLIRGSRTRSYFKPKGGKRVRRKKPRPVTAKANETGIFEERLRGSASHKLEVRGQDLHVEVGFGTNYAKKQEAKRPFLSRAIRENEDQIYELIGDTFKVIP